MVSYFNGGIYDKQVSLNINLDLLEAWVRNNPNKRGIERLREMEYGSDEYKALKNTFPYITPHGTFKKNLKAENLDQCSGLFYFDIDASDFNCSVDDLKQQILETYGSIILMLGKSIGGSGLFIYVKVSDKITKHNFDAAHEYLRTNVFSSLKIDKNALGLARPQFISYDPDLYTNHKAAVSIPDDIIKGKSNKNANSKKCIITDIKQKNKQEYTFDDTFLDFKTAYNNLVKESDFDFGSDGYVENVYVAKFFIRKHIKDGQKRKTFRAMVHTMMFLNPKIDLKTVISIINWTNIYCTDDCPMLRRDMERLVINEYKNISETGEVHPSLRFKRVFTSPLLKNRKKKAAEIRGMRTKQNSIDAIKLVVAEMQEQGTKPTIVKVAEIMKEHLSIATIKRHWRSVMPKKSDEKSEQRQTSTQERQVNNESLIPLKAVQQLYTSLDLIPIAKYA